MQVLIFTDNTKPAFAEIENYMAKLDQLGVRYEHCQVDSRAGSAKAELYDIVTNPSLVVTHDDGSLVQLWQGQLPLAEDVSQLYHS